MTDRYAVLGNPIAHSMSPKIHAYFAEITGEDIQYDPLLVPEGEFEQTVTEFFKLGKGCNITVPCKLNAYDFADELSPYAKAAGAVNTLKKLDDGSILGDNTDGRGLTSDLKRLGVNMKGAKILILGAGGAARGIVRPLQDEDPAAITLVNRTAEKAKSLADNFKIDFAPSFESLKGHFDIILNATSASLGGSIPNVSEDIYAGASFAYDLMYRPDGETIFTKRVKELGCKASSDGFGMLIMQAALSFKIWRGVEPDAQKAIEHFR